MMFGILDQYEKKAIRALYDEFLMKRKNIKWWNNFHSLKVNSNGCN